MNKDGLYWVDERDSRERQLQGSDVSEADRPVPRHLNLIPLTITARVHGYLPSLRALVVVVAEILRVLAFVYVFVL